MIMLFLQVSGKTYAQKVSIDQQDVQISKVLDIIKQQTGYRFLYDNEADLTKKISVHLKDASIDETLKVCFKNQPVVYQITDKTILITRADQVESFPNGNVNSRQSYLLKGKVTDEKGLPLTGVVIRIKNSNKGTATDKDGLFTLAVNAGDVLTASFISFEPLEVTITDQTSITIILKEAKSELNTVVVTALGIKRETRSLTYNVQQISGSDVSTVKNGNFVNDLAGKVAGATINTSSSGLGGSARVILRGTKSIDNLKNNALYVIDGVPLINYNGAGDALGIYSGSGATGDGISQLNPDDIESISVLTGPAAAALYGAHAASGVILVTTKKGKAGKTSISLSNNTSFSSPFVLPQFQNTYGSAPGSYTSWGQKLSAPSAYKPSNFYQTGVFLSNSISLSTGTEKNQTYISASNANGTGIIPNNDLNRLNLTLRNTSTYLNDKLTIDAGASYIKESDQNMVSQGLYNNPLVSIYLFPVSDDIAKYQVYERYDASRNFKTQFWPFGDQGLAMQNPYWIVNRDLNTHATQRYILNASAKFDFSKWFNVTARVRRDNSNIVNETKYYASTLTALTNGSEDGEYNRSVNILNQTYADIIANIKAKYKSFGTNVFFGASYDDQQMELSGYGGPLLVIPNQFTYANVNQGSAAPVQNIQHQQAQAVFGTAQFNYKTFLYLDITSRNDWNTALAGTTHKVIFYPSIGLSGILTDAFHIQSNALSYLKVRGAYSEVGSPPNPYLGIGKGYPIVSGSVQTLTDYPNKTLAPERTRSLEVGLNSKFFNNLISFDFTAYKSSTYNQIFYPTVSTSSGYSGLEVNAGQIDNKGIEASLNANVVFGQLKWSPGAVFSLNRNKIVKMLDNYYDPNTQTVYNLRSIVVGSTTSYEQILTEGGSTGDIYVNSLVTDEHGYIKVDPRTRVVTANNNSYIYAGNTDPRYTIGFSNQFSYGNFSMSFLVTARIGGVGVSITQAELDRYGVSEASAKARDAGGVLINGGLIPAQSYYSIVGGGQTGIGSAYVYSATNVRLGQAVFSYKIPANYFNNAIKGATLSLTGSNLFMFYNKAPFDPESTASTGTFYQGIDYFRQPSYRSVGFNVSVQF
ncbi:MAG: SusC/RagA family TonB-linked outer membrane protein [Bacteroidota bacterium]|nr:SusC/RagA family TonB-linked outer membrane protein [Bacteroidota bacterium]